MLDLRIVSVLLAVGGIAVLLLMAFIARKPKPPDDGEDLSPW